MHKETPNAQMHVQGMKGKQVFYDELNLVCMDDQLLVLKWLWIHKGNSKFFLFSYHHLFYSIYPQNTEVFVFMTKENNTLFSVFKKSYYKFWSAS